MYRDIVSYADQIEIFFSDRKVQSMQLTLERHKFAQIDVSTNKVLRDFAVSGINIYMYIYGEHRIYRNK